MQDSPPSGTTERLGVLRTRVTPVTPPRTLRELRLQRNLSQEAIAVLGGVEPSTISKIENGEVRADPQTVVKLAKALGIAARRMMRLCDQAWRDREERELNPKSEELRRIDIDAMSGAR